MSQKYVIVHFVKLADVPNEFPYTEWPLHITLLANFTIAQPLEKLVDELETYSQQIESFEIISDGEALFGPNQNVAVSLIETSQNIRKLHDNLTAITKELGAEYDEPKYMGAGFRPHATKQINSQLEDKEKIILNSFTLVDMYPNNDIGRRKIIRHFELTNK